MRAGQNPAKFVKQVAHAERITVALLTHIPYRSGFYENSLEVFEACLQSLRTNTGKPFELLVFDNASGVDTVDLLTGYQREGLIDYLILSKRNLGKGKAWDAIFNAAPGEIIAYADSDVYFSPGWLRVGLDLLETFPRTGMVTCRPLRTPPDLYSAGVAWAEETPDVLLERGAFIPWELILEHDINLGQDEQEIRARFEVTEDVRVQYKDRSALLGAGHWQFIAWKSVLQACTPLGIERPLGDDRKLDFQINQQGYLRLSTMEPLVRHLGNMLPPELATGSATLRPDKAPKKRSLFHRLLQLKPVRYILLGINNRIFRWYFRE